MSGYPIYPGRAPATGSPISSLEDWFRLAPPKRPKLHWRAGRSAMELARRWVAASRRGALPPEISAVLEGHLAWRGFVPLRAVAEAVTRLDQFKGEQRNNDLVVVGTRAKTGAVLDVEGKADETFGSTVTRRLKAARRSPRSKVPARLENIAGAIFGASPEEVGHLRYQLLAGVAATVVRAKAEGASQGVFLVHCFRTPETNATKFANNSSDLDAFVGELALRTGAPMCSLRTDGLVGPFPVVGGRGVPGDVSLYVGKATAHV